MKVVILAGGYGTRTRRLLAFLLPERVERLRHRRIDRADQLHPDAREGDDPRHALPAAAHDEAKFVSCLEGVIFDVAIDIRPDSPTYLQCYGEILSAENARSNRV